MIRITSELYPSAPESEFQVRIFTITIERTAGDGTVETLHVAEHEARTLAAELIVALDQPPRII